VSFLEARGGGATSEALIEHFEPLLPARQMPLFRQLLKQVARLQKQPGGGGGSSGSSSSWVLRRGFGSGGGGGGSGGSAVRGGGGGSAVRGGAATGSSRGSSLAAFDHLFDDEGDDD
jgi:hypothetical protein